MTAGNRPAAVEDRPGSAGVPPAWSEAGGTPALPGRSLCSCGFGRKSVIMKSRDLINVGTIVGLGAMLLATVTGAETGTSGPRPMIEVRETSKDGGVVEEGTVVPFQFEVANRGQADLELTQVKPTCG